MATELTRRNIEDDDEENVDSLVGKEIKLKFKHRIDGVVTYKIEAIEPSEEENLDDSNELIEYYHAFERKIIETMRGSTNHWLFVNALPNERKRQCTQLSISLIVILFQILSYVYMTISFIADYNAETNERESSCYGPHCGTQKQLCMRLPTGIVASMCLVGFLATDLRNIHIIIYNCCKQFQCRRTHWNRLFASFIILCELSCVIHPTVCLFSLNVYVYI